MTTAYGQPIDVPVLAVDAARAVGCALVLPRQSAHHRPRLLAVWHWSSQSYDRWAEHMASCIQEALQLCEEHEQPLPIFCVEQAEGAVRGKSRGVDVFQGLGRRQGIALAEWRHQRPRGSRTGMLVRQRWWAKALDLPAGKRQLGEHRISEARFYLTGAADCLAATDAKHRVDAAEAALLGAAVSLRGSTL